jgi:GT2 family glycosyltransferase
LHHLKLFGIKEIQQGLRKYHIDFDYYHEDIYSSEFDNIDILLKSHNVQSIFEYFCKYGYFKIINNKEYENLNINVADYNLLNLNTKWFDKEYYLEKYKDIKEAKVNPIIHFLSHGWKENRNPSSNFDTKYYMDNNVDIREAKINPLIHFLKYGQKEGRKPIDDKELYVEITSFNKVFLKKFEAPRCIIEKPIDVLIPVYNGYEYLKPLFDSLLKNTSLSYRLLICDDASPDKNVIPFLQKIQSKNSSVDIELLKNEKNLGFVGTVNRLVSHAHNHFVLLNTDTEVPPFWLERLMFPILSMKNIATTTPFTNAGTICSFPNYLEDNKIFENLSVSNLDYFFQQVNFDKTHIEIPTGVGFCMGVNKELVDRIGMFDSIFGKGYGEENDFCQRAIKEGYKNIHITNLFVYHKHGGSFPSEEKRKLIDKNLQLLNKKHPTYTEQVNHVITQDKLKNLRDILYFQVKCVSNYSTLIFDHNLGGGANHYIDDVIENRLKNNETICLIRYDIRYTKTFKCQFKTKDKIFLFSLKSLDELYSFISLFTFKECFLNSLVSYADVKETVNILLKLYKEKIFKLVIPIHDYFPLCPSYTLLNQNMEYCHIPKDQDVCNKCLKTNKGEFQKFNTITNIEEWRKDWDLLFKICNHVLCFSNASKSIFLKAYPEFQDKINVVPHDISGKYSNIYSSKKSKEQVIGILGGINVPKGAYVIKSLVEYIDNNKLNTKVVLIGEISIKLKSPSFYKTGRYKPEELSDIVTDLGITEFLIPSIWPETFSYTTDEIMQLGYPLTVFDIGAPAERVKLYKLGKVIDIKDITKIIS